MPQDLPESFRLSLTAAASLATVRDRYQKFPGVHDAVLPGQPLNGLFDDAYLLWLRGSHAPGDPQPTAPRPIPDPAVNPCGTTR